MSEILSILKQSNRPTVRPTSALGARGERLAALFLKTQGYRLVLSNFEVPVGRNRRGAIITGEIDIVALDDETLCFVEVKTRASDEFASPLATVTRRKQRQIIRTAKVYRRIFELTRMKHRYDVVTVILNPRAEPRLDLLKGVWSEQQFRKRIWTGDEPWSARF